MAAGGDVTYVADRAAPGGRRDEDERTDYRLDASAHQDTGRPRPRQPSSIVGPYTRQGARVRQCSGLSHESRRRSAGSWLYRCDFSNGPFSSIQSAMSVKMRAAAGLWLAVCDAIARRNRAPISSITAAGSSQR